MHFALGTARILTEKRACASIKACRVFFAAISAGSVSLWLTAPNVLLARITRTENAVSEDGENVDVIWKPDASQLIVLTNK